MKKTFLFLLIAAMMFSFAAQADSRIVTMDGRLFLSLEEAADKSIVHDERSISHLQTDGEYLYYVAAEACGEDMYRESLMRMDAEGNAAVIGEERLRGAEFTYAENYARLADYSYLPGYGDMKVCGDYIYFIGANGVSGSYFTSVNNWDGFSGDIETRYESGSSLYRMNKDGSGLTELIPGLGNGECHFDIANDVIAVASCWRNSVYAYDFSDFMLYDPDGKLIREIANTGEDRHSWIYKADCEFTCIVVDIQTDGERIYASLGDSEGDFASSRLTDMDNPAETLVFEAHYVPAIVTDAGIYAFTSNAEDPFYFDDMDSHLSLQHISPEGVNMLAYVPEDFIVWGGMHLNLSDDVLWLVSGSRAVCVPIEGGSVREWTAGGFIAAPEFSPPNYPG